MKMQIKDFAELTATKPERGLTVANYFDVNLYRVSSNGARIEQLTELGSAINLLFEVPTGVDTNAYDFGIVRVHNGVVELIGDADSDRITITAPSDKFSAYAIVYGAKGSFGTSVLKTTAANGKSPKTYDSTDAMPMFAWFFAFAAAGLAVSGMAAKGLRKEED